MYLRGMPDLTFLIVGTQVTDAGVAEMQKWLSAFAEISHGPPTPSYSQKVSELIRNNIRGWRGL